MVADDMVTQGSQDIRNHDINQVIGRYSNFSKGRVNRPLYIAQLPLFIKMSFNILSSAKYMPYWVQHQQVLIPLLLMALIVYNPNQKSKPRISCRQPNIS